MSKGFESIKRGLRQAIRHGRAKRQITTKAGHRAALEEIQSLMDAKAGTARGRRLGVLASMVEAYERKRFPQFGDGAPKLKPPASRTKRGPRLRGDDSR